MRNESLIGVPRWRRLVSDCEAAGFLPGDARRFAEKVIREMPSLAAVELPMKRIAPSAAGGLFDRQAGIPKVLATTGGDGLRGEQ
jgi:hypothetical protein